MVKRFFLLSSLLLFLCVAFLDYQHRMDYVTSGVVLFLIFVSVLVSSLKQRVIAV